MFSLHLSVLEQWTIFLGLALGSVLGFALGLAAKRWRDRQILRAAQMAAEEIVLEANEARETLLAEEAEKLEEFRQNLFNKYAEELDSLQSRVEAADENYRKRRSQSDREYNLDSRDIKSQSQALEDKLKGLENQQKQYVQKRSELVNFKKEFIAKLSERASLNADTIQSDVLRRVEEDLQVQSKKKWTLYEDDVRLRSEELAKKIMDVVLSRFNRASCTERGIGTVEIPSQEVYNRFFDNNQKLWNHLQTLADVDLTLNDSQVVQIASYDPVKRETVTRSLERMVVEKRLDEAVITRIWEKTKREVESRIREDGERVAKELNQADLHPEIKAMLGSLRYRYSFAQNQHYHVAEVGWLCGLLAQELKSVSVADARRSGLLHDIGKAMDHAIEGGHAVIGADFISHRGEKAEVVHAVRSHHFEEQPSTDLAYLVIAADAISGARPGARRSTANVYSQKMEVLSTIGDGFPGVLRTLVFSAGREVRILVDGQRVSDEQGLVLCRQIADKIEVDCEYPGQIKVVLVRETHSEAMAK